ncbi:MAG: type II toxin-antitoxin system HicA family toxin [Cyanobacteriota bacterium]
MPKLPHVSGKEIIRALERLGFQVMRQSGSHVVMRQGSRGCIVPLHPQVKVGTLAGLLRQAQVDPKDFLDVL